MHDQIVAWLGLQELTVFNEGQLVDDLIYQGTIDLLSRTKCVVRCVDLNVSAGEDTYTLDHSILGLVDVENGARARLRRNDPGGYGFTLIRSDLLQVKPTPSVNGQVQVWGVMRPQQMTADADSPGQEQFGAIPDEFQDAIVTYALWKAGDYADDASSSVGERYRILYEGQDGRSGRLAAIRSAVNKRGTAKGPRRGIYGLAPVYSRSYWVG
jgi:hypothetical protein